MREAVFRTWGDTGQNRMTFSCSWKKRKAHQPFNSWSLLQVYTAQKNKGITTKERKSVHINKICLFSESIYDTQALYFSYLTVLSRKAGKMARWKPCTQIMSPSWNTSTTWLIRAANRKTDKVPSKSFWISTSARFQYQPQLDKRKHCAQQQTKPSTSYWISMSALNTTCTTHLIKRQYPRLTKIQTYAKLSRWPSWTPP